MKKKKHLQWEKQEVPVFIFGKGQQLAYNYNDQRGWQQNSQELLHESDSDSL